MKLLGQIWKEGIIPTEWKKGIIVPLYKREDQEEVGNYRGILLLCTAYKVYAEILRTRLEKAVEEKNLIPESQTGFRKGKSAIDNILNHIVQKEKIKGNKVYAMFADLKAAFDNVDRNTLWKILREGGIKGGLIKKVEEMYEGTEVIVRTKRGYTERFWTKKGVKQGCVISPLLFNMYMAKVEEDFRKRKIGGIEVGKMSLESSVRG